MKISRTWRQATAGVAAATLLLTVTAGAASAQLPELPSDPEDLQEFLENLDADALEDLLEELGLEGDDNPLQAILDALQGDDEGDDVEESDDQVEADAGTIPETGMGGFAGFAEAAGVVVFVGLPAELADGLDPVLSGLGIAGSSPVVGSDSRGIRIDLARVQADLERAAAGEDISSEASAFVTNLLLASGEFDEPGACEGGPMNVSVPEDQPFLTLTLAGVDCDETDERAFADVQIAGLAISLANLVAQGDEDGQLRDGLNEILDPLNEGLGEANQLLCPVLGGLGFPPDNCEAEAPILQIANPLDLDVPLIDLDVVGATAEVTQDGDSITATATSSVAGLNLLGVVCEDQLHTSTATSDGTEATRAASVTPVNVETCNTDQTLVQLLLDGEPIGDIGLIDGILQDDLLDGALDSLFDGLDDLLDALSTTLVTSGQATLGPIEGAGTTASTSPFVVARTLAFSELEDSPLGDLEVVVAGGETAVGVNAVPAGEEPPAPPEDPTDPTPAGGDPTPTSLPRTGAGAGLMLGLAALGAAGALRRRES